MANTFASRRIKEILDQRNIPIYEVADACGIIRQTLYYFLNSDKKIKTTSFETICKIAKYLNVDVNEFNELYETQPKKEYESIYDLVQDLSIELEEVQGEEISLKEYEVIYYESL